jgi:hypothetical protein
MTRSIGARLAITISVLTIVAAPATASASAARVSGATGATGAGVPPGALAISVAGSSAGARAIDVAIDPGSSATRRIVVVNRSTDLRLTTRLGPVAVGPPESSTGEQASWVTLSDVVETLEPGASASVTARILVPANAVPGAIVVNLVARVERAVHVSDGSPVSGTPSASVPVRMTVKGAPTAQVSIVGVQSVSEKGQDYLAIEFQNVGATAIAMHGRARVATSPPETYAVDARVAPLTSTVTRVAWVKPAGSKGITVSVDTDNARGDQAAWSGTVGTTSPTTVAAPQPGAVAANASASRPVDERDPFLLGLLAAVALAVLWFAYEMVRALVRGRKRRRLLKLVGLIATRREAEPVNAPVPVAANADQIGAVAAQIGALVGAIENLTARLDAVSALPSAAPEPVPGAPLLTAVPALGTPIPAPPPPPSAMPARSPGPAPKIVAAAAEIASALGDDYPYDWPTPEQLDRFVSRKRAVGDD